MRDKVILNSVPVIEIRKSAGGSEFGLHFHQLEFKLVARYPYGIVQ